VLSLLALVILTAIAAVLISPAVPSAPTLLPVSAFVLGIMAMACLVVVRMGWPTLGIFHQARPQCAAVALDFATGGHPLRR
jgi:hypothetical protein